MAVTWKTMAWKAANLTMEMDHLPTCKYAWGQDDLFGVALRIWVLSMMHGPCFELWQVIFLCFSGTFTHR